MASSPYFDGCYFDGTYFDASVCGGTTGRGGKGPIRRRVISPQPPVLDDGDELFALFYWRSP